MSGAGVAGLAGGFGKALSAVLLGNRQEKQRQRERQEEVEFRNFQATLPIVFQNFQQNPTPEGAAALEDMLVKINPDLKKSIRRSGFSFETLGPLLSQMEPAQPAYTEAIPEVPGATRQVPAVPAQPTLQARSGAMAQMPDQTTRLFGAPVLTAEQRQAQQVSGAEKLSEAEIQGKVQAARRLLATGAAKSMEEALDRVGLRRTTTGASTAMRFGGILKGDQAPAGAVDQSGRPLDPNQYYRTQIQPDGELLYLPTVPPGGAGGGEFLTRAAIKMGYRSAAEVPAEKRDELFKQASAIETEENRAGRVGTGIGAFQSPMTAAEAQQAGVPAGTTSAAIAGQKVPTQQERTRRENAENIKLQLDRIRPMLTALPSEKELGGLAPGAVNFARNRLPAYRNQYAQLEAAINNIRAALTRTMQANVGTETERDAERALSTLADFQGSLFDPLKGDTRESAAKRLDETIAYLEQVMKTLPAAPVAGAGAPRAGAAPNAGGAPDAGKPYQDGQGNWIIP